jgi:hypothetical protein
LKKSLLCLLLALLFVLSTSIFSFAAPEDTTIPDPNANPNTGTVEDLQYEDIEDAIIPAGPAVIPGNELAPTGGFPVEIFYGVGAACVVSAVVISRKKPQSDKK